MKNNQYIKQIVLQDPEKVIEIKKHPAMGWIFIKAFLLSFFRSNTIKDNIILHKTRIVLKNYLPDQDRIKNYRIVCNFSNNRPDIIPISYLQTLFIGLMGKFVTSSFFPVNPMGLIHIFQSFDQKRPVKCNEILDLTCNLAKIEKKTRGIETSFSLEVRSKGCLVWQGTSILFTRSSIKKKKFLKKKTDNFLDKKEIIMVPAGTGRRYAGVSGDYNPHHLYTVLAKLFGFKKAIVHGMWSIARVIADLETSFGIHDRTMIEVSFKLPVFMPAVTALGYEYQEDKKDGSSIIAFELRDEKKGLPHLKGKFCNNHQGNDKIR